MLHNQNGGKYDCEEGRRWPFLFRHEGLAERGLCTFEYLALSIVVNVSKIRVPETGSKFDILRYARYYGMSARSLSYSYD